MFAVSWIRRSDLHFRSLDANKQYIWAAKRAFAAGLTVYRDEDDFIRSRGIVNEPSVPVPEWFGVAWRGGAVVLWC